MRITRFTALLLTVLLLAGCTPRLAEAPPPQRIVQYGYSFVPPAGKGWHIAGRNRGHIIIGHLGPGPDETTMVIAGNSFTPPLASRDEFEAYVREHLAKDAVAGARFSDRHSKVTMLRHAGADCAHMHLTVIDHEARKRSGRKGDMTLEITQLYCRHPDNAGVVTYLSYSQRYYPGDRDPDFDARAGRLLDSLAFSRF